MENYFNQSADDTAKALGVDVVVGITEAEAQERSAKYGKNRLEGGKEKSILQMAIQGKLVPQDSNDEPALVLLEKIRAEKQRLIKEGKIKKDKGDSIIFKGEDNCYYEKIGSEVKNIEDEIPFEIPDSWIWTRLKELVYIETGKKDANFGDESGLYNFYTCAPRSALFSARLRGKGALLRGRGRIEGAVYRLCAV